MLVVSLLGGVGSLKSFERFEATFSSGCLRSSLLSSLRSLLAGVSAISACDMAEALGPDLEEDALPRPLPVLFLAPPREEVPRARPPPREGVPRPRERVDLEAEWLLLLNSILSYFSFLFF